MNPFYFPETIICPECGSPMELMMEGDQIHSPLSVTRYAIYHCTNEECMYDHITEKRWELAEVTERRFFHG